MGTLRQSGGLSGFAKRSESEYDSFGAGHSSTSISSAMGMSVGKAQLGKVRGPEEELESRDRVGRQADKQGCRVREMGRERKRACSLLHVCAIVGVNRVCAVAAMYCAVSF